MWGATLMVVGSNPTVVLFFIYKYIKILKLTFMQLLRCRVAWLGIGLLLLFMNYFRLRKKLVSKSKSGSGPKVA